jgi:hypothetical protein
VPYAYVDESHYAEPPGFYLLAAALFDGPAAAAARATMQELTRVLRVNRVHWHDLDAKRRDIALACVTRLSFTAVAVVGSPMAARQERARRQCLGRLLWETGRRGTSVAMFESRGPRRDPHDVRVIDGFRRAHTVPTTLSVAHAPAAAEPLLWVADVLAGVVAARERGGAAEFGRAVEVHRITLC